jgi:hypothetical protein
MNVSPSVSNKDARRLVLGAAVGFGVDEVRVFVESLRGTGYKGDIMMLIAWPGVAVGRYLKQHGVKVQRVFQTRSFTRSVHARRYLIYTEYLKQHGAKYDQVMLADTRDVVFQKHPFEGLEGAGCHFFLEAEGRTIGEDETNWRWVSHTVAKEDAEKLAGKRISCSGITIGGTKAIVDYLQRLSALVSNMPFRIYREIGHGYDQALHNYLVHLVPEVDGTVTENNGHIATMAIEPRARYTIDDKAVIRLTSGHTPAICHQYDRFPDLRAAVEARWR